MKKALTTVIAVICIVIMCTATAACDLFTAPKVNGRTYEYESTECDTSGLTYGERLMINTQLSGFRNNISKLVFSEEGTVAVTSSSGITTTYDYSQVGTNVIVPGGPNKNTNYQGDTVLGFTVSSSNKEVLKWSISLISGNGTTVEVVLYYNVVPEEEESV